MRAPVLPLRLRLGLFKALEALSELRRPSANLVFAGAAPVPGQRSIWIYATTIGELNAVESFLRPLIASLGNPPITLLTNHAHYAAAYLKKFPDAGVISIDGTFAQVRRIVEASPPQLLLVAEIPCLLHDAPCRLSYATLHEVTALRVPIIAINAWLYGYTPASRMDHIEKYLFGADYVRAFDLILAQTESVRDGLVGEGASLSRVVVTGNLKYDGLRARGSTRPPGPLADAMRYYAGGPIVVAGSVTDTGEQQQLLRAFHVLWSSSPGARLVLAPRHPENASGMAALRGLLCESPMSFAFRSEIESSEALRCPILVLDTMGELRDCYENATFAFVGTDHNVLEPLAFACLVYVSGRWEATFPSHPVYLQCLDAQAVVWVPEIEQLGAVWLHDFARIDILRERQRGRIKALLESSHQCLEMNLSLVLELLSGHSPRRPV